MMFTTFPRLPFQRLDEGGHKFGSVSPFSPSMSIEADSSLCLRPSLIPCRTQSHLLLRRLSTTLPSDPLETSAMKRPLGRNKCDPAPWDAQDSKFSLATCSFRFRLSCKRPALNSLTSAISRMHIDSPTTHMEGDPQSARSRPLCGRYLEIYRTDCRSIESEYAHGASEKSRESYNPRRPPIDHSLTKSPTNTVNTLLF